MPKGITETKQAKRFREAGQKLFKNDPDFEKLKKKLSKEDTVRKAFKRK